MVKEERRSLFDRFLTWLDERAGIYGHTIRPSPRYAFRLDYWLGSFVLAAFLLEVVTGPLIAIYYTPSDPYTSTKYLISSVPFGALLFSIHTWGAYAMVFFLIIHMTRNFIVGAYRSPREIMWVVGSVLALLTLAEAFLGYSLPYNVISWTATTTGLNLFSYMPFGLGNLIAQFTIVDPNQPGIISGVDPLVQRFFIFHWIVGGLILAVLGLHLYIFEKHGITPPLSAKPNAPELIDEYRDKLENDPKWRLQPLTRTFGLIMMTFLMAIGGIFIISSLIPFDISITNGGLTYVKPEFTPAAAAQQPPLPDWYFLFVYFFYKATDPTTASWLFLLWSLITALFPFIDVYIFRHKAPHPAMRPAAISLGTGFIIAFIVNSIWAYLTPGQDIGSIGLIADALIFILCFAIIYPLLKFVAQPRVLRAIKEIDGGNVLVKGDKEETLKGIFYGVISMLTLIGFLLSMIITYIMTNINNLIYAQFSIGFMFGLEMIATSVLLMIINKAFDIIKR
jgi:quinol-cytochrome oxidoreductase complex cytochrome b subunit